MFMDFVLRNLGTPALLFAGIIYSGANQATVSADELPLADLELASCVAKSSAACDFECDSCDLDGCDSICGCESTEEHWALSGFVDAGFLLNTNRAPSRYNGPYNQNDQSQGALNQTYLILQKKASERFGLGGRFDLLYGADYFLAQSRGFETRPNGTNHWNNEDYGLALPQGYAELGTRDLSIKAGHFYTLIGYEGVPATSNFFYSKSNSYMFAGPFTHWGSIASWQATRAIGFDGGVVNGWNALDRTSDSASFLGRARINDASDAWNGSFGLITGNEENSTNSASTNRTRYSLIFAARPTKRTEYVFHHWLGVQDQFSGPGTSSANWYGIDQYLFYRLTDIARIGARVEWFKDSDGVRIGLDRPSNPNKPPFVGDLYSASLGVNVAPTQNLMVRPEIRFDKFDGTGLPFKDGTKDNQLLLGMDAIVSF